MQKSGIIYFSTESAELGKLPDSGVIAALKLPTFSGVDSSASKSATAVNSGETSGSKIASPVNPVGNQATAATKKATSGDSSPFTLGEELPPVPAKLNTQGRVCGYGGTIT